MTASKLKPNTVKNIIIKSKDSNKNSPMTQLYSKMNKDMLKAPKTFKKK